MKNIIKKIWSYSVFQPVKKGEKEALEYKKNSIQFLYGEITEEGTVKMIKYLRENELVKGDWNILDIGSGFGKMVMRLALEKDITESHGIELSKSKNDKAIQNFNELIETFPEFPKEKVKLIEGNIKTNNIKKYYDIVFHNSIAWLSESVFRVNDEFKDSIHISTKAPSSIKDDRIKRIDTINVKFSWSKTEKGTPIYIYKLN